MLWEEPCAAGPSNPQAVTTRPGTGQAELQGGARCLVGLLPESPCSPGSLLLERCAAYLSLWDAPELTNE